MNEQTQQLVEQLAGKLGITAEHLWAALLRQAPVSSAINLAVIVIAIGVLTIMYSALKEYDFVFKEEKIFVMAIFWFISILLALVAGLSLPTIFSGFFNPEYWALKEILER